MLTRKANETWREEDQKRQMDEQTRIAKLFQRFTAVLVVIFIVALGAAVFAIVQWRHAQEQEQIARSSEKEAIVARAEAESAREKEAVQRKEA